MKLLLVAEYREGKVQASVQELLAFAAGTGADQAMFIVGDQGAPPPCPGVVYVADSSKHGEYNPSVHKELLLQVIAEEQPELVVFSHSSYGWDLAPRIACALEAAQVSEVVGYDQGTLTVPVCNAKLRRDLEVTSAITVITLQAGAFSPAEPCSTPPSEVRTVDTETGSQLEFLGYQQAEAGGVDLSKAEIIVSAGRGIGKAENIEMIAGLAKALGGEYGASRPVVDAEWVEHTRQVGTTGQTVAPKLYIACGISGAIQHLAGMKKSDFVIAVNTDREAPIGEVADVLVVADLTQFVPLLTEKILAA